MSKIDTTQPLQLTDGTKCTFLHFASDGDVVVRRAGFPDESRAFDPVTGKHCFGRYPNLQNVPAKGFTKGTRVFSDKVVYGNVGYVSPHDGAFDVFFDDGSSGSFDKQGLQRSTRSANKTPWVMIASDQTTRSAPVAPPPPPPAAPKAPAVPLLDTSKPLQTRSGTPVRFVGKMEDGRLLVEINYQPFGAERELKVILATGRIIGAPAQMESSDDIINKHVPVKSTTYRNIYADGTVGPSVHKTFDSAEKYSKLGKVRAAILSQEYTDGVLTGALSTPTQAFKRTSGYPSGVANPWA